MKKNKVFSPKERKQHKKYKVAHKQKKTHKKENKTVRAHRPTKPAIVLRAHIFGQNDKFQLKFCLL